MGFTYWFLRKFCQTVTKLYFRKINVIGLENIPKDGPIIICGNHANQFIDPMMIGSYVDRDISFTIAASSFNKPVVGFMAKSVHAIPVKRPEDSKVRGTGKITISSTGIVKGINTKFEDESKKFTSGFSILVGTKIINIKKQIDNENMEVIVDSECADLIDKESDFFFVPKLDNSFLFKEAYNILNREGCICIFPEGTSHDRTDFIKLKAGIAFMALGAMSEHKSKPVRIVPVGLNYFNRDEFRSEVIIEFGKPFEVPQQWGDEFTTNKKVVTEKLLKEIESRMKAVTLRAPSFEELKALLLLRKIYVPKDVKLSPTQYSELCKRFAKGYEKLKENPECKDKISKINNYMREIDEIGVKDSELRDTEFKQARMKRKFLKSVFFFFLYAICILPGILIIFPFLIYIRKKAEKERIAAKQKNPNKIAALDVVASVKVFSYVMCQPFIMILWIIFFNWFAFNYLQFIHFIIFESFFSRIVFAIIYYPVYVYTSTEMLDYLSFCLRTVYSRTVFFFFPDKLKRLKAERVDIGKELKEFVDKYAKEVDPEYENNRIIASNNVDISKDDYNYLETRSMRRTTKPHLELELNAIISVTK